jgi:type VI secretion system secreted protein VgrG
VTVKLALPDDSTRYFNGYVTRFVRRWRRLRPVSPVSRGGPAVALVPDAHADCRIFQEMTVPDIIKAVFGDGDGAIQVRPDRQVQEVDYCVQYREDRLQLRQPPDWREEGIATTSSTPRATIRWC